MILAYLILAHLLGDFVFQPGRLVFWKMKSKMGVLAHASVHFILSTLILAPYIINGHAILIAATFGLSFAHFWIDAAKINYDLKHDEKVLPFIVDQMIHLITIAVAFILINERITALPETPFYSLYGDLRLIIFFSFLVFLTTVVEVFHFTKRREKSGAKKLKINTNKMLSRVIVFTLIYGIFLIVSFYTRDAPALN